VEVPPRQAKECEVALSNSAAEILSLQALLVALHQGHVKSQQIPVKVGENIHLLERKFNDTGKRPYPTFPYHICIARILLLLLLLLLLLSLVTSFLTGTSLEPAVIPTAQVSSFTL
jgi:hypothetical protein